jgi:two-component system NtrC family sensor kinase
MRVASGGAAADPSMERFRTGPVTIRPDDDALLPKHTAKAMIEDRYYGSLRRNILVIIIMVSLTPLLLITAIGGYQFHTAYRHKVVDHLCELVDRHTQHIDTFLAEKLSDMQVLASICPVGELREQAYLEGLLRALQEKHHGGFVDLGLVNEEGFQVAYAGPFKLTQARYADALWFKNALARPYTISDVFLGLRGLPHFIVAVQIQQAGSRWVFRSTIDFVAFNRLVEELKIGTTGQAFIVNKQGEFQTQPRSKPMLSPAELLHYLAAAREDRQATAPAREAPPQHAYQSEFTGILAQSKTVWFEQRLPGSGRSALVFSRPLKEGQWVLFYLQEVGDAFSDLYRARRASLAVLILGALAIAATAWGLSRRVVNRIIQIDREKEMMNEQVIEAGKLASIGELAAGIAHEINNPVAIMVEEAGWVEDLLGDARRGGMLEMEEACRALGQIRTQGVRCKEITHKLLSFARRTDPAVGQVQLNRLIEDVVALVQQRARFSGIRISTHLAEGLPLVMVSASELQQVLLNLINNAMDAMETPGGRLDITTRTGGSGRVIVDVADTGQGIPQAILQRIFDPFFTTKPVGKGTGLGLSICCGIIKKMGGDISVNSAVGVGTTFHLHLPADTAATGERAGDESPAGPKEEG